jgi:hypothetical protein
LVHTPILQYPDFEQPFTLYTDASKNGLGAVLSQKKEEKEYVIAYASRATNNAEKNYPITDLECLAIVWEIRHFHHYLSRPFSIVTDHSALKWLQTSKMPKGRRARWIMELQQYTFTIQHRPGKSNANADALSRMYDDETECFFLEFQETEEPEEVPESSYTFSTTSQWYTAQGPSTQEFMLETDSETEEEKPYQLRLRYDPERPQFRFEPISGANPDRQRVVHIQYDSQGEEIEEEERS